MSDIREFLDGSPDAISTVRSWIRGASTPYRQRLANDLEDLEQDILIGVTESLRQGRFDGRSSFKTYVRSFAVHKCIDRIRFLSRREWIDVDDLELKSNEPSALESLTEQEKASVANEVLRRTPETCRNLWTMLHEGMRYEEMAERTGVAAGTLRVRVLRCTQRAQKILKEVLESL